ncbi:MAG: ATP-binding protein [Spirochaetota bacterium]|nr:ATP-binding protein [Spirochaetota bacterium]
MYLKKIKNSFKKIHFRLALIFSLIFIISSGILFAFSFLFLYNSMNNSEEDETKRRLLNYWALFQSSGIDLVIREIDKESFLYGDQPFFARIADKENTTLFLRYPEAWSEYLLEEIENIPVKNFDKTLIIQSENSDNVLKAYTVYLSDDYFLQIGISTARSSHLLTLYRRNFIFLLLVLVLPGFGLGIFFSRRFLSPIRNFNSTLKEIIATGDFSKRIPERGVDDDMEEISILFNQMLKRIETLIVQMKGNLDVVAHELRTPMTIFRGYAEQAIRDPENIQAAGVALSASLEQSEKIISMLNTIMDISEAESGTLKLKKENLDLKLLVKSLVEMYEFIAEERNITIVLNAVECKLEADPIRIRQAIGNILDNAVKYSPDNSIINIDLKIIDQQIILIIQDRGFGITKEDIPFIWDRLYRSPDVKSIPGTGLGLSLVKAVITAHNGFIEIESSIENGSKFTIYFSHN